MESITSLLAPQCNKMPKGKGSLPPKHGLELLTVYAWEQGSQDSQFSMAEGFRTVLELVTQYRQLCVYWTINYDDKDQTVREFLSQQLQKPRSRPSPHPSVPEPPIRASSLSPYLLRAQSLLSRAELLSRSDILSP